MTETLDRWKKVRALVEAALDRKGEDILVLDVREVTSFCDTFVVISGSSDRNLRAIVDSMRETARGFGERPLGVEGYETGRWILVDFVDVVIHVFLPDVRAEYELERLYADAAVVDLGPAAVERSAG